MSRLSCLILGFVLVSSLAHGCGLGWTLPSNHFDSVDEQGSLDYWESIGEIKLGNNLSIPVHINFNSHRSSSSQLLGKGWQVALVESHVEPVSENQMSVVMPDGWVFTFLRNGNTQTWRGSAGWIGETNNTAFTIAASCGAKIKFDKGRIQEINYKNSIISYKYNGSLVTEIDADNKIIFKIEPNSTSNSSFLTLGDKKLEVVLSKKPSIIMKLGKNYVNGFESSLSRIQWFDGKKQEFEYLTDKNLNPVMSISGSSQPKRIFTWDASTSHLINDGEWTYSLPIKNDKTLWIERINKNSEKEAWIIDSNSGIETTLAKNGTATQISRFSSGILKGKTRKIEEIAKTGSKKLLFSASYDEKGNLIRSKDSEGCVFEWKDIAGGKELQKNGTTIYRYYVDSNNRITKKEFVEMNSIETFDYSNGEITSKMHFDNGSEIIKKINSMGKIDNNIFQKASTIIQSSNNK